MIQEMKDSGIKWIGEIPADWELNKIKYIAVLKGRIGWQGLTSEEYTDEGAYLITGTDFDKGGINWESCVHVPMTRWEEARDIQIENGDLLITKDGTVGKVAIVSGCSEPTSLNSGVLRISLAEGYDRRFLFWVLQSDVFWSWFTDKNAGNSTIQHLYQGDFAEFKYAIPPLAEQQSIATFLDEKCAKLDSIIADLQRQIEILQEYKKSVITQAVTKGLNPDVSMKDSGIEWIGEIPSHWKSTKVKYVTSLITKGATPEIIDVFQSNEFPIRFIKAENLQNGNLQLMPEFFIDVKEDITLRRSRLMAGDVLFVIAGATIGKIGIVHDSQLPANINQAISILRPSKKILPKYLYYVLSSNISSEVIRLMIVQAAQPNISMTNLGNIEFPLPSLDEQSDIIHSLDEAMDMVTFFYNFKIKQLTTIQNAKSSLIYEYVTGKKRVKEAAIHAD